MFFIKENLYVFLGIIFVFVGIYGALIQDDLLITLFAFMAALCSSVIDTVGQCSKLEKELKELKVEQNKFL